jgi:hypothetical protein
VLAPIATYGGIALAIWMFYPPPKDIFDVPPPQLTLGDIARTIFYVIILVDIQRDHIGGRGPHLP